MRNPITLHRAIIGLCVVSVFFVGISPALAASWTVVDLGASDGFGGQPPV